MFESDQINNQYYNYDVNDNNKIKTYDNKK